CGLCGPQFARTRSAKKRKFASSIPLEVAMLELDCNGRRMPAPTRRELLKASANGFGLVALSALLSDRGFAGAPTPAPHFRARAQNVIFCFMDGGVSHVDSFDPKPKLAELDGRSFTTSTNPTASGTRQWLGSPWRFQRHGQSGIPVSDLFPHIASC